ncbi:MAG TPA: nitrilase-related carbon-nitrogen hydrolase [Hyphomicrobiaceae bacterium]|nr:nitrilase-related carbon-nitrogen hydrolase [Hyphomicrobiaceae bacterium]
MAAARRLRVAAAQYPLDALPNMQAWREKTNGWVSMGAATGARLLVFPEYAGLELAATRGVAVAGDLAASLAAAADCLAEADAHYRDLACRYDVAIVAPSAPARRGTDFVNAARLITPGGDIGVQEKLILTPFERAWGIKPGGPPRVFETALGRMAIAICYDAEFPLIVRGQAEAGAEIVLIPTSTELMSGYNRVRTAARARALENQIATVMAPTVGDAPWSPALDRNTGRAGIFVPADPELAMTGVLVEGDLDRPGWVAGDIDLDALHRVRSTGETRNAADWTSQPGAAPLGGRVDVCRLR